MLAFPFLALALALIAIGRGSSKLFLDERPRDRTARKVMFILGIVLLIGNLAVMFL